MFTLNRIVLFEMKTEPFQIPFSAVITGNDQCKTCMLLAPMVV